MATQLFCMFVVMLYAFTLGESKDISLEIEFRDWVTKYGKQYSSVKEYRNRFATYVSNHYAVKQLNEEHGPDLEFELNHFADLTFEEFKSLYLFDPQHCSATNNKREESLQQPKRVADPLAVDWREKNVITPVKNQGACGSCWTFSTTGCLEAHHAIKTGQLISLSEQQLVDCAGNFNNNGCDGGLPSQAFEYIKYNGGLESEEDYPYDAKDGKCVYNSSKVAATVSDVVNISKGVEEDIGHAVTNVGPVSIAYDVNSLFQMFYKKGIYKGELCSKSADHVNHAVLVVGYNQTESGEQYWIVKNSWSKHWGMDGYFWIERGKNACGLADCASYPVV